MSSFTTPSKSSSSSGWASYFAGSPQPSAHQDSNLKAAQHVLSQMHSLLAERDAELIVLRTFNASARKERASALRREVAFLERREVAAREELAAVSAELGVLRGELGELEAALERQEEEEVRESREAAKSPARTPHSPQRKAGPAADAPTKFPAVAGEPLPEVLVEAASASDSSSAAAVLEPELEIDSDDLHTFCDAISFDDDIEDVEGLLQPSLG